MGVGGERGRIRLASEGGSAIVRGRDAVAGAALPAAATVGSEAGDALGASMLLEPAAELTLVEAEEAEAGEEAALEDAAAGSTS